MGREEKTAAYICLFDMFNFLQILHSQLACMSIVIRLMIQFFETFDSSFLIFCFSELCDEDCGVYYCCENEIKLKFPLAICYNNVTHIRQSDLCSVIELRIQYMIQDN